MPSHIQCFFERPASKVPPFIVTLLVGHVPPSLFPPYIAKQYPCFNKTLLVVVCPPLLLPPNTVNPVLVS